MLLADEPNIREVILFPMNQQAEDLLMNAPTGIDAGRYKELYIKPDPAEENKSENSSGNLGSPMDKVLFTKRTNPPCIWILGETPFAGAELIRVCTLTNKS